MRRYRSELMRCENKKSGKTFYYVEICGVFTRISKEEYYKRYNEADGFELVYTKGSKTHKRHYITAIYEYE